jgi:hypothetical protein
MSAVSTSADEITGGPGKRMLELLHQMSRHPQGYWPARWKISRHDRAPFAGLLRRGLIEEAPMESTTTYRVTEAGYAVLERKMAAR